MIMVFGVRPGMGIAGATGNREEGFLPPRRLRFRGVPTGSISSSAAATMVFITRHGTGMPGPSGIGQEGFLLQRQWRFLWLAGLALVFPPGGVGRPLALVWRGRGERLMGRGYSRSGKICHHV